MTRRAMLASVAGSLCLRHPDPERIDDDNPEWTAEDFRNARPAAEVLPQLIGQKATDELMQGLEPLRARARERMRAAGYDPDNEDDVTEYVDRIIHEYREEERQKEAQEVALPD